MFDREPSYLCILEINNLIENSKQNKYSSFLEFDLCSTHTIKMKTVKLNIRLL